MNTSSSFDSLQFRQALGCFATGVTVLTTRNAQQEPVGVTINSFTSVSLEPPLVLFCLGRKARSFDAFAQAPSFAVNILSEGQQDLSNRFAKPSPEMWQGLDYTISATGCPRLPNILAFLECQRHAIYDGGDHAILVGRIQALWSSAEGRPLAYFRGKYTQLK